jgi:hypothetical protein
MFNDGHTLIDLTLHCGIFHVHWSKGGNNLHTIMDVVNTRHFCWAAIGSLKQIQHGTSIGWY